MIKNFYKIFFLFFSINVFSQNVEAIKSVARFSSDTELKSYINKAKDNGLSLMDVENLAKTQGATFNEVQKIRTLWNTSTTDFTDLKPKFDDLPLSSFGDSTGK